MADTSAILYNLNKIIHAADDYFTNAINTLSSNLNDIYFKVNNDISNKQIINSIFVNSTAAPGEQL